MPLRCPSSPYRPMCGNVIDECLESEIQAFVAKPVDRDRLDQVLGEVLAGRHATLAAETDRANRPDEVIDRDYLDDIHKDPGSERFRQAIETCINSLHEMVAAIDSPMNDNHWDSLKAAAHRLKGVSGSYGLTALHRHARQLEKAAVEQAHRMDLYPGRPHGGYEGERRQRVTGSTRRDPEPKEIGIFFSYAMPCAISSSFSGQSLLATLPECAVLRGGHVGLGWSCGGSRGKRF